MVILASWSSNDNNLYSASLSLTSVLEKFPKWVVTILAGLAGGAVALIGGLEQFEPFLSVLGTFIPPIAGVYVTDFFMRRNDYEGGSAKRQKLPAIRWSACFAWVGGCVISLLVLTGGVTLGLDGFNLTSIPALDGLITSCLFYGAYYKGANPKHG